MSELTCGQFVEEISNPKWARNISLLTLVEQPDGQWLLRKHSKKDPFPNEGRVLASIGFLKSIKGAAKRREAYHDRTDLPTDDRGDNVYDPEGSVGSLSPIPGPRARAKK